MASTATWCKQEMGRVIISFIWDPLGGRGYPPPPSNPPKPHPWSSYLPWFDSSGQEMCSTAVWCKQEMGRVVLSFIWDPSGDQGYPPPPSYPPKLYSWGSYLPLFDSSWQEVRSTATCCKQEMGSDHIFHLRPLRGVGVLPAPLTPLKTASLEPVLLLFDCGWLCTLALYGRKDTKTLPRKLTEAAI